MRLREIPAGHVVVNDNGGLLYVGKRYAIWLNTCMKGEILEVCLASDEYEDLGSLSFNVQKVVTHKVTVDFAPKE